MTSKTILVWTDIFAALGTHLWFRNNETEYVVGPIIALLTIPTSIALTWASYIGREHIWQIHIIYFATLLASVIIYRISPYHPLAHFPGPTLCKVSKLWTALIAYEGDLHKYHKKLHEEYGPIVRVGPNEISVIDKEFIPLVLGTPGLPKGPLWTGRSITPLRASSRSNSLISVPDLQRHAQLRKPWNKAFGNSPLNDYSDILVKVVEQLNEYLVQRCKSSPDCRAHVDLSGWISFFSFDFMGQLAFDGEFELMRDGDKNGLWHDMEIALLSTGVVQHVPWLARLMFETSLQSKGLERFVAFAVRQAKLRSSKEIEKKDLYYHLLNAADPDSTSDPFPLIAESAVLTIIAGSDTTATVLSNVMFYLLAYPGYLSALRQEIDENFPLKDQALIDLTKLSSMTWLNAIINETLRLQPALPTSVQRGPLRGSGGKQLGNIFVPEGTGINIPPYCLHRDRRYFSPHTEDFWPPRWFADAHEEGHEDFIHDLGAFIPFSFGPANCAGKSLAMIELRYVTTMLVRNFNMSFEEGFTPEMWEENLKDRFVMAKGPLPVIISPREI